MAQIGMIGAPPWAVAGEVINLAKFLYYLYVCIAAIIALYFASSYLGKRLSGFAATERWEAPIAALTRPETEPHASSGCCALWGPRRHCSIRSGQLVSAIDPAPLPTISS